MKDDIDLILKLLPLSITLTGERRKDYFEKLIKPLYEKIDEVHSFYNEIILEARDGFVEANSIYDPYFDLEELEKKRDLLLDKTKENFMSRRRIDEHLRDALRLESQDYLANCKWKEERRFLVSVAYYFLGSGGINPSDERIDSVVDSLLERGGRSYWNTPSIRLYLDMRKESAPRQLIDLIDINRHSLNQKYMNLRRRYRQIETQLVLKT